MAMSTTGLVAAAAMVSGAVGAGAAILVVGSTPATAPADRGPALQGSLLDERIQAQDKELQRLRAEVQEVRQSLAALRAAPPRPAPRGPGAPEAPEGLTPEAALALARESGTLEDGGTLEDLSPEARSRFEAVYRQMREREQDDARKAREAVRESQLRSRLERVQDQIHLTADQKETVVRTLMDRGEKLREVFEEARGSGNPEAFRDAQAKAAEIRADSLRVLESALTVDQMKVVEGFSERGGDEGMRNAPGRFGGGARGGLRGGRRGGDGQDPPR